MTGLPPRLSPVELAAEALRRGRLVAFPTETVYGLGADASDGEAVRRIFAVKGRPAHHPLIVHVADPDALDTLALDVPEPARRLAVELWPGPLTLVVALRPGAVVDEVTGGRSTVAVRVPAHPVGRLLLRTFGGPVAAPSANRFGRVSPTTAAHVRADLGDDVDVVLDGGPCPVGVESTIVDATGGGLRVLRLGGIGLDRLAAIAGDELPVGGDTAAPGTLASHYAPRARVEIAPDGEAAARRAAELAREGRAVGVLAPATDDLDGAGREGRPSVEAPVEPVRLVVPADAEGFARLLYARLREADEQALDVVVAVAPADGSGLAEAIADRLRRAAGPR